MRNRRVRINKILRHSVIENTFSIDDFIYPLFVVHGNGVKKEIRSLKGVYHFSIDEILKECKELISLNIRKVLLFGVISKEQKDAQGSECLSSDSLIAQAIKAIKNEFEDDIFVISDLCFCEYTSHGHCGILDDKQVVHNDKTLKISTKQALIHASAGVDMIAPSGMMDNIVSSLREALDSNGYEYLPIMSYSTKFASVYYEPFREVANSTPSFGDRRSYQMSVANGMEALNESLQDEIQGADILMVKPALSFLDVIKDIKQNCSLPLAVYNVSGEYAMLKSVQNSFDYERLLFETMISFKRAGADIIISYHTKEIANILKTKEVKDIL